MEKLHHVHCMETEIGFFVYPFLFRRKQEAKRKLHKTLRANPLALILALDLEVYEHDHSIILEVGYAMTYLDSPEEMQTFHYIIKENLG